jgi:hypothetical protein
MSEIRNKFKLIKYKYMNSLKTLENSTKIARLSREISLAGNSLMVSDKMVIGVIAALFQLHKYFSFDGI